MRYYILILILSLPTLEVRSQSLTDSLAAYYPFNGSGTDLSGNNNNLTTLNVIDTMDRAGNSRSAYWFNGSNSYLYFADWNKMFSNNFSFSCWIRIDTLPDYGTMTLILNIGGTTKDAGIQISYAHLGQFSGLGIYCYQTTNASGTYNTSLPDLKKWTHLTGTRDNDSLSFWVNGKLVNRVATKFDAELLGLNSGFYVGCKQGISNFYRGGIDDIRIYKKVLKANEILLLTEEKVSISDLSKPDQSLSIYPNPANSGLINISCEKLMDKVEVFDCLGKLINITEGIKSNQCQFNLLEAGCFTIKIHLDNSIIIRKALVLK